jgi:hypothetical protein
MMPEKFSSRALLAATAITAVAGLYGGMARFGIPLPRVDVTLDLHGLLMMQGVFGTLVPLERSVALGRAHWFAVPAVSAAGIAALLAGLPVPVGSTMLVVSAILFVLMSVEVLRIQATAFNLSLLLGALALLLGTGLWAVTGQSALAFPSWLSFLVLTVAGERLELGRFIDLPRGATAAYFFFAAMILLGAAPFMESVGGPILFGVGLSALAGWLLRFDIARVTVRAGGQTRFMGVAILSGHSWLLVSGAGFALSPALPSLHDGAIHGVTVGFAMSMVMGHAMIILPAVAGIRLNYSLFLYAPLAVLHVAVAARFALASTTPENLWLSGSLTLAAIVAYIALAAPRPSIAAAGAEKCPSAPRFEPPATPRKPPSRFGWR